MVGSHGLKRKKIKPGASHADNAKRLTRLSLDANRLLLACLPVEQAKQPDAKAPPTLCRKTADGRLAMRLRGDDEQDELTRLLAEDPHYGAFCGIPGKDNGLDIEGLAVLGAHLLLGLRGPVLGGWAGLLEIAVQARDGELRLKPPGDGNEKLRKHFLQLDGLGVRDLHLDGDDLYLLAGPTMVLDGAIRLYRWPGARQALEANREPAVFWPAPEIVCEFPHGRGTDRAEAYCAVLAELVAGKPRWLALYDAPGPQRHPADFTVLGDLLRRD